VRFFNALLFLTLILCLISSCSSKSEIKKANSDPVIIENLDENKKTELRKDIIKQLKQGLNNHVLSSGDVLEVMYHISSTIEKNPYTISVGDELNIDFFYHPETNRVVVVRPDGMITLPIKGDFFAAGMPPCELAKNISRKFSDIYVNSIVTVNVNKFSSKLMELQKAITNSPLGQAKLCKISPDGNLYLPMLENIQASGKTINELKVLINLSYAKTFENLEISILLHSSQGNQIFILGEVQKPGSFSIEKPMTVLQAITVAGGVLPTGSIEKIKIAYIDEKNEYVIRTVNLSNVIYKMRLEEDFIVPNNSIVFVPMTTIAKLDKFVDQHIKQLILFQGSSIGFSYELHREPIDAETQRDIDIR
jgi:polysaccharide export outer membrane protein